MSTWPNRGASGGPCGGLEEAKSEKPMQSDHVGLTQANRPPRNPVRFTSLAELQLAAEPKTGKLYTFHFNALRSIMEKTASFFGHADISFCLKALNTEDLALYNRALNLLSHGKYAIHEPTEMGEDNKDLFRRILKDFTNTFQFDLPELSAAAPAAAAPAPPPTP